MSFDFSTLVTDRTQADVNRVKQIAEKIKNGIASESELAKFNGAAMKGAYNYTDLNRVTAAMESLKAKLEGYGYAVPGYQRIKVPHALPEPEPTSRLPEGYTELTYIESTGTQYIDTNYVPTSENLKVSSKFAISKIQSWRSMFGSENGANGPWSLIAITNDFSKLVFYTGTSAGVGSIPVTAGQVYELTCQTANGALTYNCGGTTGSVAVSGTVNKAQTLYVFTQHSHSTSNTANQAISMKLYDFRIYDNGVLVRDYIPCINPDGVVGLYDLVTAAFFGNSGTGSFVAGTIPRELPEGYTQVEYIQSNGTQYIDTGWKFGSSNFRNVRIVADSLVGTAANGWAVTGVGTQTNLYYGCGNGGRTIYYGNGNGDISSGATYTNVRATWDLSLKDATFRVTERVSGISLVNINISVGTPSLTAAPFFLFAYNDSSSTTAVCHTETLYGFKIYENSTLVRDYVPCKNPSGVFGLYDLVNDVFYQNAGSGTFAAGEEIVAPATASVMVASGNADEYDPYLWYEFDWPTPETMTVYLLNVSAIRAVLAVMKSTPSVPGDMVGLMVQEANNIEKILVDVNKLLEKSALVWFYSDDLFAGEVD